MNEISYMKYANQQHIIWNFCLYTCILICTVTSKYQLGSLIHDCACLYHIHLILLMIVISWYADDVNVTQNGTIFQKRIGLSSI